MMNLPSYHSRDSSKGSGAAIARALPAENERAQQENDEPQDEEGKSTFRMPAFIRKHAVASCLLLLFLVAVGAGLGVAFSSSTSSGISSWTHVGSTLRGVDMGDEFGGVHAIALSGDGTIIAVGASGDAVFANNAGYIQVFQRGRGTSGQQKAEEWQPMGAALEGGRGDQFGSSVALSSNGRILAVGARAASDGRPGCVRVYAYDSTENQWNPRGSTIVGASEADIFCDSVALSSDGKVLAVGAQFNDENGYAAGHVRVFAFNSNSTEWVQVGPTLNGVAAVNYFGYSLDLSADGTILAVGAVGNAYNGQASGHVRAFQFNSKSNDWDPLGAAIPGVAEFDLFGCSVALSSNGTVLAVGARHNDDNGSDSGHVRVFEYRASTKQWIKLGAAIVGLGTGDTFGYSVALSADGNQVAAGAVGSEAIPRNSGHVRVFQYKESSGGGTGQWKQVGASLTGLGGESDLFGSSVALSADGAVVAGGASEERSGYVCVDERAAN